MRVLKCFQCLLVFTIIIQTSWAVDLKATEDLIRNIVPNPLNWKNPSDVSQITPSSSIIYPRNFDVSQLTPSSLSSPIYTRNKKVDNAVSELIAENILNFGHQIGLQLAALDPYASNSEIFSPLSLASALSFLMLGAKGKSYQELKQWTVLNAHAELENNPSKFHEEFGLMLNDLQNFNGNGGRKRQNAYWRNTNIKSAPVRSTGRIQPPAEQIIKVANGLFVQDGYTLNPDYSEIIKSIYDSELTPLDFLTRSREARDYINAWVNKNTFGKIPQIINDDIEKSTNVILASVLYFKGFWETPFFPRSTTEDNFYPDGLNNPPIRVQMMPTGGIFPFYDAKEYDCRIIGLPYKGNETTMYVIQPNNSSRSKLRELQSILTGNIINKMIDNMERKTTVMVFPKMHFTRSMTMKTLLQSMGIHDIFQNGYSDLSLIGGKPPTVNYASAGASSSASASSIASSSPQFIPENIRVSSSPQFIPENSRVSFESIYRKPPSQQKPLYFDRYNETPLIFSSRFGEIEESVNDTMTSNNNNKEVITTSTTENPTNLNIDTDSKRNRRQVPSFNRNPTTDALLNIESDRLKLNQYRSDLFVDDIIHKVDFTADEQGTEAAAATVTYLHRSGTDVVFRGDTPFLFIIRHDPTKLPLFYGIINKPEL